LVLLALFVGGLATLTVSACSDETTAPPEGEVCLPEDGDPSLFCNVTYCSADAVVNETCTDFFADCAASTSATLEECVAGALESCQVEQPEPDPSLFCNETYCSSDPAVNEECTAVFTVCAADSLNAEECVAAALISCQADPDGSLFCNETYCSADPAVNEECSTFFAACLAENPEANAEECAAGALGVCRNPSIFCDSETCVDPARQQQCTTDLAACIAGANEFDYDECIAASFLFCRT
jgi:hypothetical protein